AVCFAVDVAVLLAFVGLAIPGPLDRVRVRRLLVVRVDDRDAGRISSRRREWRAREQGGGVPWRAKPQLALEQGRVHVEIEGRHTTGNAECSLLARSSTEIEVEDVALIEDAGHAGYVEAVDQTAPVFG